MSNKWDFNWEHWPITDEGLTEWRIYIAIWKDAELTPAGHFVNKWLRLNKGYPAYNAAITDKQGWLLRSIDMYLFKGKHNRH